MEKCQRRKKAETLKQVTKVYKLRKRNPTEKQDATSSSSSSSSSSGKDTPLVDAPAAVGAAGGGDGGGTASDESPSSSAPPTLLTMEQQLRAGITPTLPSNLQDRANLARTLPPLLRDDGRQPAPAVLPQQVRLLAPPLNHLSVIHRSVRDPTTVAVTTSSKKRPRGGLGGGRGGGRGGGAAGAVRPGGGRGKQQKRSARVDRRVVATDWSFSRKKGAVKTPAFFDELWMMMAAFGDTRGDVACKCDAHGQKTCPCVEAVAAMEARVQAFGVRLVSVCREWSGTKGFSIKHLRMAVPGEALEFSKWRDAHSKRGTKSAEEKGAGVRLADEDAGDDDGEGEGGEEEEEEEEEGEEEEEENGEEGNGGREWGAEEEEVANRMQHRKTFFDERTAHMDEETYTQTFFGYRKAFFLVSRTRKQSVPGSRGYFVKYLGIGGCKESRDKKLLDALAYMMYDYVGLVVETAIRKRSGGRLVSVASDAMFSADEVNAAAARLPSLPSRERRERVRASRAANPDGIAHRPLPRFRVGLEHRGDPLKWPRNTIEEGKVLVEGGELVDASDKTLAEEAMAIWEADFADFD